MGPRGERRPGRAAKRAAWLRPSTALFALAILFVLEVALGIVLRVRAGGGAAELRPVLGLLLWAILAGAGALALRRCEEDPPILLRDAFPVTLRGELPRDRTLLQRIFATRDLAWVRLEEEGLRLRRRSRLAEPFLVLWFGGGLLAGISGWLLPPLATAFLVLLVDDPPRGRRERGWAWPAVEGIFETADGVELILGIPGNRESLRVSLEPAARRRLLLLAEGRAPVHRLSAEAPPRIPPPPPPLGKDRERALEEALDRLSRL